jgi:hypothetical protein
MYPLDWNASVFSVSIGLECIRFQCIHRTGMPPSGGIPVLWIHWKRRHSSPMDTLKAEAFQSYGYTESGGIPVLWIPPFSVHSKQRQNSKTMEGTWTKSSPFGPCNTVCCKILCQYISKHLRGRRGCDRMIVWFTTTYAISAYTTDVVSSNLDRGEEYTSISEFNIFLLFGVMPLDLKKDTFFRIPFNTLFFSCKSFEICTYR